MPKFKSLFIQSIYLPNGENVNGMDPIVTLKIWEEKLKRRFWEIEGFSKVSCGGTHVKSTAEVGYVILKRKNIGDGKERIEISLIET